MENYFYKCPVCGFIHLVPAYWINDTPDEEISLEHLDIKQGKKCVCTKVKLLLDEK